mgnify:CR=1 FL=1
MIRKSILAEKVKFHAPQVLNFGYVVELAILHRGIEVRVHRRHFGHCSRDESKSHGTKSTEIDQMNTAGTAAVGEEAGS